MEYADGRVMRHPAVEAGAWLAVLPLVASGSGSWQGARAIPGARMTRHTVIVAFLALSACSGGESAKDTGTTTDGGGTDTTPAVDANGI